MNKCKKLSLLLVVVIMVLSTMIPAFAVEQQNIQEGSQANIQTQIKDNSTITPMNPKKIAKMKHVSNGLSEADITVEGIPSTSPKPSVPDGIQMAGAIPNYFHFIVRSNDSDLRTITVTVEAVGCYTPILSYSGFLNIRNYNGVGTSSNRIYNSLFYNKTWTFTIPITATVEENITLQGGSLTHLGKTYTIPDVTITRTNQIGGSYNSILSAMGGERHHCFASEVYTYTNVNTYDLYHRVNGSATVWSAPCILMTPEDHKLTKSWGNSDKAQIYRNEQIALVRQGKYLAAMQKDIDDIHSRFGNKYNNAISQMWVYATTTLGWYQ